MPNSRIQKPNWGIGLSIVVFTILLLLIVIPLAKGGNSAWVRAFFVCCVTLAFVVWHATDNSRLINYKLDKYWILVWNVFTLVVIAQVFPGFSFHLHGQVANNCFVASGCGTLRVTGSYLDTLSYWALFTGYWMLAWMVSKLDRSLINIIIVVILILGLFESIYGLVAFVGEHQTILGLWKKVASFGSATGTFVNRNHFSGYLELVWCIGIAFILSQFEVKSSALLKYGFSFVFSMIMGLGILGSSSRLGVVSAGAGLVLLWWLVSRVRTKNKLSQFDRVAPWFVLGLVALSAIWFGLGVIIARFGFVFNDVRYAVWSSVSEFPLSVWLFGFGAGNFLDAYKVIEPIQFQIGTFAELHSDILEFILGLGIIGSAVVCITVIYWFRKIKNSMNKWSLLNYGALSSVVAMLVHSLGDFNLQIPGVAVLFWVIVGIMMNDNLSSHKVRRRKTNED